MIFESEVTIQKYTSQGWWGQLTIDQQFSRNVTATPNVMALVDAPNREELTFGSPQRLTYSDLDSRVNAFAAIMLRAGIGKDDIVVVQLPNIVESVIVLLACARIGAIASPLLVQFDSHELGYIIEKLRPKLFISVTRFKKRDLVAAARPIFEQFNCQCIALDSQTAVPQQPSIEDRRLVEEHVSRTKIDANEIFTVCWTSGTEGRPKGVMRTHNNWFHNGRWLVDQMSLQPGCVILNLRPFVNMAAIGGSFMSWLMTGGGLVLHHPLDIGIALEQIRTEKVNLAYMPPAFYVALLADQSLATKEHLSSLQVLGTGSAPVESWVIERMEQEYGIEIVNIYGSNEGGAFFSRRLEVPDPKVRSSYFPRFGRKEFKWPGFPMSSQIETRIIDPETEEEILEPGRAGEMRVRSPNIFSGYFGEEDLSRTSFDDQGFYRTGDLFEIAGPGELTRFYRFVGRIKEIIVRGGLKISPAELDSLISQHPLLKEAAFFGYPDDKLGEKVGLAAVPIPGAVVTLPDIVDYLKAQHIAVYKLPERLVISDGLPRNAMMKLQRNLLHEV